MTREINSSKFGERRIISPQYSSYNVRLSTFGRFPLISGVNVQTIAAAGFFYTGHGDVVRCYACDGGLKNWVPRDDPWEEHYKWFPDCPHLVQSNFKPLLGKVNAAENKPNTTSSSSAERIAPEAGLIRKLDKMTIDEEKTKQQDWDLDMDIPAVLAVLDHGYSKQAVKLAISKLRRKGRDPLTAMNILDVLLSYEDLQFKVPTDDTENPDSKNKTLERKQETTANESTKEISSTKISNSNGLDKGEKKDAQLGFLLEENKMLTSRMTCKRCRKRNKDILVLPCTHFCLCDQCSMEVSLCPECWKPIQERIKTYNS
ncbi:hypothetical protein CHS0354_034257 [Potamilus streckersoni]|uniref:RING-type domain-containing protein n=1 Tax=Potamilus streckersoni TaxID=2493646 RepID=A0AAE0S4B0_9BIVA|nr:hypothetical protein CHS0354_034257 [Potamilus streckersoni]